MTDRRARRRSAIENDERILDAAVSVAVIDGADRLTANAVARAAGFTSGAIYARYGQREEILVSLWEHRAASVIERLIRDIAAFRRSDGDSDLRRALVDWLDDPPPELRIGIELCLIAHRIDELWEVIPGEVRAWLADAELDTEPTTPNDAGTLGLLAAVIGHVMLQPFEPALVSDLDQLLRWGAQPSTAPVGEPSEPPRASQELLMEPDDAVHNDLLLAAQAVIARSGVHRTTLSRIGRVARLAPATVYGRYASRDDLIHDILRRAQQSQASPERRMEWYGGDAQMAASIHAFLQPEALVRRRVHSETIVAAWHDDEIARSYAEAERSSMEAVADAFPSGLLPHDRLVALQQVALAAIHGSAVLLEALPAIARLDWRPSAATLMTAALADA